MIPRLQRPYKILQIDFQILPRSPVPELYSIQVQILQIFARVYCHTYPFPPPRSGYFKDPRSRIIPDAVNQAQVHLFFNM